MSTTTPTEPVNLREKVALVTGSTSGIGLAIARCLAKRGVNIIISGFGDQSLITTILEQIRSYEVRSDYVAGDLSKLSDIESLWSDVLKLYADGIDILINNAGILHLSEVENFSDDKWNLLLAINLSAPFHLAKRCIPGMRKKGWGRIVNMSSISGLISRIESGPYSATKHGLIGLTKSVALENAQYGITCNAVCPKLTQTPIADYTYDHVIGSTGQSKSDVEASLVSRFPIKSVNTPEQVAELVEFLCLSIAASQMTGASYLIDGGWLAM